MTTAGEFSYGLICCFFVSLCERDHFTCYCLDSRGHGESTAVEEFHYQDMADDVAYGLCSENNN